MGCSGSDMERCDKCGEWFRDSATSGTMCEHCEKGDFRVERVYKSTLEGIKFDWNVWKSYITETSRYSLDFEEARKKCLKMLSDKFKEVEKQDKF